MLNKRSMKFVAAVVLLFLVLLPTSLPQVRSTSSSRAPNASIGQQIVKTTTMYVLWENNSLLILRPELEFNSTTTVQYYYNGNTTTTVAVCRIADPQGRFLDAANEFPANATIVVFGSQCEGLGIFLSVNGTPRTSPPYVLSYMAGKTRMTVYAEPELTSFCVKGSCASVFAIGDDLGKIASVVKGNVTAP